MCLQFHNFYLHVKDDLLLLWHFNDVYVCQEFRVVSEQFYFVSYKQSREVGSCNYQRLQISRSIGYRVHCEHLSLIANINADYFVHMNASHFVIVHCNLCIKHALFYGVLVSACVRVLCKPSIGKTQEENSVNDLWKLNISSMFLFRCFNSENS